MARISTATSGTADVNCRRTGLTERFDGRHHNLGPKVHESQGRCTRYPSPDRASAAEFDIFSDHDAPAWSGNVEENHSSLSTSPRKQKKTKALKATNINSLLLPLQQSLRQRPSIKVETDDYEKENDIPDNVIDSYSATMDVSPQWSRSGRNMASPARGSRAADRARNDLNQETDDEDNCGDNSFNSLDDFIVSDNDELSFYETSDSDTAEESQKVLTPSPPPPPKSTRKRLMRGRRPSPAREEDEENKSSAKGPFELEPKIPDSIGLRAGSKDSPKQPSQEDSQLETKLSNLALVDEKTPASELEIHPA